MGAFATLKTFLHVVLIEKISSQLCLTHYDVIIKELVLYNMFAWVINNDVFCY